MHFHIVILVEERDVPYLVDLIGPCAWNWREICAQCGLLPDEVRLIGSLPWCYSGGPVTCLTEGLTAWCKVSPDDGIHSFHPRLSVLIKALRSKVVGEGKLANKIVKNWCNLPSVKARRLKGKLVL